MGVEAAVRAEAGLGVALLVLKGSVLVAKAEHHQKQDRDMCLEVLPDPHLAPKVTAAAIRNLGWKLMNILENKKIQTFMLHHIKYTTFFALKNLAFSKYPVGLLAVPTVSRRTANLLAI